MKNAVVIVTYNRLDLLKECLACVSGQTIPFSRVIVVDNHSTDGTRDYLLSRDDVREIKIEDVSVSDDGNAGILFLDDGDSDDNQGKILLLEEEKNLGGAGGFYDGLKIASMGSYDWVLVIDDDAMISSDYMEKLLDFAKEHDSFAGLAGSVHTEGQIDISHRRRITNKLLFVESNVSRDEYEKDYFICDEATFCGFLIRGSVMESIGLPKREYFLWYDDTEYSLRLQEYGGIAVVPKASLHHKTVLSKEGMETKGVFERISWRQYYGYRNRYDTAKAHVGKGSAFVILWQYRVFWLICALMGLKKENRQKSREKCQILTDIIRDCKAERLGLHEKYHY